jgi:hypothetical protein
VFPTRLANPLQASHPQQVFLGKGRSWDSDTETLVEWVEIRPGSAMLKMVTRVSTRIFMGEEMCRNDEWLTESALYTKYVFQAIEALHQWPDILRPWVAPFLPVYKEVHARMARCREILKPVIAARSAAKAKAIARGETAPVYDDSLEWFEKEYENYDPATSQYVSP